MDLAEKILKYNQQNQNGEGQKMLTPDQMITDYFSSIKSRK